MVRDARNVHVTYEPLPFRQGWLIFHLGRERFRVRRIERTEFSSIFRWARQGPQRIARAGRHICWLYEDAYFWVSDELGDDATRRALQQRLHPA